MINFIKKGALFFYSFVSKRFFSKVLKINILTIDMMNYIGALEMMGATIGATCGSTVTGIPTPLGTAIGILVGKKIGNRADEELREVNKRLKIIDRKRDEFSHNDKTEKLLVEKFDNCIDEFLNFLIFNVQNLSDEDKKLNDKELLTKFVLNMFKTKGQTRFSCLFIAELMSDEKIREKVLEIIKNA